MMCVFPSSFPHSGARGKSSNGGVLPGSPHWSCGHWRHMACLLPPLDRRVCRTLRMCSLRGNSVMQPNRKTNMKIYDLRRKPEGGWGNGLRGGWGPSVHHAWPVSFSIPHIHIVRWACCFLYAILWIMRQHCLLVINSNGDSCETDKNWCTIEWICFWCGKMRPAFVNVRCGRGMGISIPWPIRMMLLMPPLPGSAFNQRLLLLFSSLMFK